MLGHWGFLVRFASPWQVRNVLHIGSFYGLVAGGFDLGGSVQGFWVVGQHCLASHWRLPRIVGVRPHPVARFLGGWLVLLGFEELQGAAGLADLLLAVGCGHGAQGHVARQPEHTSFGLVSGVHINNVGAGHERIQQEQYQRQGVCVPGGPELPDSADHGGQYQCSKPDHFAIDSFGKDANSGLFAIFDGHGGS